MKTTRRRRVYRGRKSNGLGSMARVRDEALDQVARWNGDVLDALRDAIPCEHNKELVLNSVRGMAYLPSWQIEEARTEWEVGDVLATMEIAKEKKIEDAKQTVANQLATMPMVRGLCMMPKPFERSPAVPVGRTDAFRAETDELCTSWRSRIPKRKNPLSDAACKQVKIAWRNEGSRLRATYHKRLMGNFDMTVEGKFLDIHGAFTELDMNDCRLGRKMYEIARAYACREGLRMRSDTQRSIFSECFWRRQYLKGRADCAASGQGLFYAHGSYTPVWKSLRDKHGFEVDRKARTTPREMGFLSAAYSTDAAQTVNATSRWGCRQYALRTSCAKATDPGLDGLLGAKLTAKERREVDAIVASMPSAAKLRKTPKKRGRR